MSETFDVVVAGAGHNSLVAAAYLARAGLSCLVLEAREDIGGDTSSEELTLPGFLHDSCSTAHNLIQSSPVLDELGLAEHGLEYLHPDPVVHLPFPDGSWLTMWRDEERTYQEFVKFAPRDAVAVTGLVRDRGRCAGVETERGDRYLARMAVLSTIHIKHLIEMAPAEVWGEDFRYGVATWQPGISMFVSHYATTEPPRFATADGPLTAVAAGTPHSAERMLRLATDFRAGRVATDDPVLLVLCPTVADPSRTPEGGHTLKVVGFQPYELAEGPERWDEVKAEVSCANLAELRRYAPNLTDDVILGSAVKSPLDLERMNAHNWHGSCHGGDAGPAQSGELRPVPGWASHRMPIPGLYQTGATTHPGGSVSGAPGRNAAAVMLADLGRSIQHG
jgi:phytoene dehydrogenase-like protein